MKMMMKKEVKFSSFDNCRFATLSMLSDVIHFGVMTLQCGHFVSGASLHRECYCTLIWLCRGKNAHTIVMKTGCTGKLLQGEMCQSSIDKMTRPIMSVFTMAFVIPVSCVYI